MGHDGHYYQADDMPRTNSGFHIREIDGDPTTIRARGQDIEQLGEMMRSAARTLQLFADGTVGKGASFQAIRDQASEVHSDLAIAGDRYAPSGSALIAYANALRTAQSSTNGVAVAARSAWDEVNAASRRLSSAEYEQDQYDIETRYEDDPTRTRPDTSAEQASFDNALGAFETYRTQYDAPAVTWERAYDTALTELEDTNENGVSDGFWDDAMPFIEGALTVLMWVGIALVIVAFVFTGPIALIAGALAAVAGVLSLLGEVARLMNGRGSVQEVVLAGVGIIPFGKFAKLGRLADFAADGARFPRLTGGVRLAFSEYTDGIKGIKAIDGALARRFPDVWDITRHGTNTRNLLFRPWFTPRAIVETTDLVGSWRGGWQALAGFAPGTAPQTLTESLLGTAEAYKQTVLPGISAAQSFGVGRG
ncbi:hypothetical protein LC082_03195 [Microbacterium esteraromaticum]|uniref:hypothetical protein n=1 Tax=Microbacterium esteraromaticum TaxID=57043 RepID=UPI001CD2A733|nr:hypothetical protein [Microbacterium esteraromaticum]MCA1305906.1 hypothetical protein [Microbacterium esteraromaticum]